MPNGQTAATDESSENRPVPSQAEGDEETIDESLKQKEQKEGK